MSKINRASVFAALGDPIRLQLLDRLRDGSSITKLADGLPITRQAVTRHLQVLEDAKLVKARRYGRERLFEAQPDRLCEAKSWLDEVAQQWDAKLARLKDHIETKARAED